MPGSAASSIDRMKVTERSSFAASRTNSWRTPSGSTMSPRVPPLLASTRRTVSSWMNVLPRPNEAKIARRPPRTAHTTASRWCGLSSGWTSSGSHGSPPSTATCALAARKSW